MWPAQLLSQGGRDGRVTAGCQMIQLSLRRPSPAAGAVRMIKGPWRSITLEPRGAGGRRATDRFRMVSVGRHTAMKLSTAPGDRPSSRPPRIDGPEGGSGQVRR